MKYRKKPVVIEAVQWTGNNFEEIKQMLIDASENRVIMPNPNEDKEVQSLLITTLEGVMRSDLRELHYVILNYGFSVEDADEMLQDPKTRRILLKPLLKVKEMRRRQKKNIVSNITLDNSNLSEVRKSFEQFKSDLSLANRR